MPPWAEAMGAGSSMTSFANPIAAVAGSIAGSAINAWAGQAAADEAWKRTKKLAQNQVQWRVEDAKKAGLHPLAALGMNPASGPAPAQIGDWGDMGVGNAIAAMQRGSAEAGPVNPMELIRQNLELDLLKAQIGEVRSRSAANTAGTAGVIGNTKVKDMNYGNMTQGAWSDGVSAVLGIMRFFEDSWNTAWEKWPSSKGPFGTGWPAMGKVGSGVNMGVPKGYLGRR